MLIGTFKSNQRIVNMLTLLLTSFFWLPAFFLASENTITPVIFSNYKWLAIIMGILVLSVISFPFDNSFALDYNKHVTLEDLGILQLAAHDLFNVDRMNKIDFENRKLDLSTIFVDTVNDDAPFDANIIAIGGEARNRENIMLFTVASELGLSYVELLDAGFNENDAKCDCDHEHSHD